VGHVSRLFPREQIHGIGIDSVVQEGADHRLAKRKQVAWETGFCLPEKTGGHFCRWVLLARPSREMSDSFNESGILDLENQPEQGQRQGLQSAVAQARMEGPSNMGA
jgi:hypothetical protein